MTKRILSLLLLSLFVSACSVLQKKVNPAESHTTEGGFHFRFAMTGDWYPGQSGKGLYMVGQKPQSDGTTKVAVVRHGPLLTSGGKAMTNKEMLNIFKRDIEAEAQGGRVSKVKSTFTQKKYKTADCLYFEQSGEDLAAQGPMSMTNDGVICLHPKRKYQFVWLGLSERRPFGKVESASFNEDKKLFFESLDLSTDFKMALSDERSNKAIFELLI